MSGKSRPALTGNTHDYNKVTPGMSGKSRPTLTRNAHK